MSITRILEENARTVNSEIKNFLPRKVTRKWLNSYVDSIIFDEPASTNFLSKPTWDLLDRGGKRWRPLLMFLACEAVGGNPSKIKKFAVIPELIHNGSLIADDVEDNSAVRRGKPTINIKYGIDVAVNLGSLLYFLPLVIVRKSNLTEDVKVKLYELVNEELLKLHIGQGTDIYWHKSNIFSVTENQYFSMCANKTGVLARLSAEFGVILGRGTEKQFAGFARYAEAIGIAFQIQDDILNLKGGLGKDYGEDITEGKMSLPVIQTLSIANKRDKAALISILKKHSTNRKDINAAIEIINRYNSLEYSKEIASKIIVKAWNELHNLLVESPSKRNLQSLTRFMVDRSF